MPLSELLFQAFSLMLTGMSVVFIFLGILVVCIPLLQRFAKPEPSHQLPPKQLSTSSLSPQKIAAITSAVQQYRQQHRS